jgi:hypothetical protein
MMWPEMPDCGAYLVWPENSIQWIHPDDVSQAERWIPSSRVFRRDSFDGVFYRLRYGQQSIRVKPTMWLQVTDEGFEIGDQVELLSHFRENDACIATILEIRFEKSTGRILYSLESRELMLPRPFEASDLAQLTRRPQLRERD